MSTFPFLRAPTNAIKASEWVDENGEPLPIDDVLPDWDTWTEIKANREITVNMPDVRNYCGLGTDAELRLVVTWHSPITALRECAAKADLGLADGEAQVPLYVTIPGHKVAGELNIHTNLIVANADKGGTPLSAVFPGSSLWNDHLRIQLEGNGARFPVEVNDFPASLQNAGWKLDIAQELEFPFLGGVRLYINRKNVAVLSAIETNRPGRAEKAIVDMIHADTARQLIRFALTSDEFSEKTNASPNKCPFTHDSTGYALWILLKQLFPEYSITALKRQLESMPEHFNTLLQHRVRILE